MLACPIQGEHLKNKANHNVYVTMRWERCNQSRSYSMLNLEMLVNKLVASYCSDDNTNREDEISGNIVPVDSIWNRLCLKRNWGEDVWW